MHQLARQKNQWRPAQSNFIVMAGIPSFVQPRAVIRKYRTTEFYLIIGGINTLKILVYRFPLVLDNLIPGYRALSSLFWNICALITANKTSVIKINSNVFIVSNFKLRLATVEGHQPVINLNKSRMDMLYSEKII